MDLIYLPLYWYADSVIYAIRFPNGVIASSIPFVNSLQYSVYTAAVNVYDVQLL